MNPCMVFEMWVVVQESIHHVLEGTSVKFDSKQTKIVSIHFFWTMPYVSGNLHDNAQVSYRNAICPWIPPLEPNYQPLTHYDWKNVFLMFFVVFFLFIFLSTFMVWIPCCFKWVTSCINVGQASKLLLFLIIS